MHKLMHKLTKTRARKRRTNTAMAALKGAVAGAVGVWALDKVTWFMLNHEDRDAREREDAARPDGLDPAHVLANKVAGAFGTKLDPPQPNAAGIATHYMLGILPAAAYGVLRRGRAGFPLALGFGVGLFLLQDELLNPLMGTSSGPRAYPWQAHARGLAGHLAYGAATEGSLELMEKARAAMR
jgi:hypothetical protein